jgi:hypothetical protein
MDLIGNSCILPWSLRCYDRSCFRGVTTYDWYRYLHNMVYVYYVSFHYTDMIAFPKMSMQPDVLCHRYLRQNRLICNIVLYLLNTKINLLWIMTTNWFLIYVYRLITRYRKLGKQQRLSVKVSMRWDVLWPAPCSIYVVADFKRLGRLDVLKHH